MQPPPPSGRAGLDRSYVTHGGNTPLASLEHRGYLSAGE
jgi:hypothetical protein